MGTIPEASAPGNILVRQHERVTCELDAFARVEPGQGDQVVLSRSAATGGRSEGEIRVSVVDVSPGGLGVRSPIYLPRGTKLRVIMSRSSPDAPDAHQIVVRVQRSAMIDRSPAYYLGGAFVQADPRQIDALLDRARSEGGQSAQQR